MHESISIPACFSAGEKNIDSGGVGGGAVTKSGQCAFVTTYRTKLAGQCRLITITWFKDLLLHGLSVAVDGSDNGGSAIAPRHYSKQQYTCKIQLKPWMFWKKHSAKHFTVDNHLVTVVWDLRNARFHGETEPQASYYVAVICQNDIVLLLGDMKQTALAKTGCRPGMIDPILVSRKEHVFGRKRFSTKTRFSERGGLHEISIELTSTTGEDSDQSMTIRVDGEKLILVKHLQWKFRGNESVFVDGIRVEVFWDAYEWLFGSGSRHAVFVLRPDCSPEMSPAVSLSSAPSSTLGSILMSTQANGESDGSGLETSMGNESSRFCLFLYAWKLD